MAALADPVQDGFDRAPFAWLPAAVRQPISATRSILVGWAVAFLPSVALAALVSAVGTRFAGFETAAQPAFPAGATALFALVIFAPLVETLIMVAVLLGLLRLVSPAKAVLLSALGWGVAHSLAAPAWGLVIWWPFLIFSTLFVAWRRQGFARAALLVAAVHGLHNLLPALMVASS
jgi:hypothetical protein